MIYPVQPREPSLGFGQQPKNGKKWARRYLTHSVKNGGCDGLEQIGMGSGTGENDAPIAIVIIHKPVVFDMTFDITIKVARKPVFPAAFGQRFFPI